ncbi:hypothetical protein SCHPADRAFT_574338 [Schizopora paradoxa]|uniref:BRCA2 OB1 domain-containing protein n=1 Tax=Schizopora paradoxa TaxID=27342 RepID=A0A0H2RWS6_9AGAM|nr:hypothetical protein SCHPADRAFT_574338 [Schizopora paradoxa]
MLKTSPLHHFHLALRSIIARKTPKTSFVTPFKPGMKPGDPGRVELERSQRSKRLESLLRSSEALTKSTPICAAPSPVPGPSNSTLKTSGFWPQKFSADELQDMGVDVHELSQITPEVAPFYAFNVESTDSSSTVLGPTEALSHLLRSGRTLATKAWVQNHWSMILWKLAGMVCLDPTSESVPSKRRWCWEEVIRQLEHRYDRELAGGQRPALRLIAAQDAPAAAPMVLCVSKIVWPDQVTSVQPSRPPSKKGKGKVVVADPLPQLEVTDGWYRLRAQVDETLARACKKGTIRVGRKIAVVGAKLDSQKKDAAEILDAYDSVTLVLTGNSTHLAQWHAKLGFQMSQPYPFIATLHKLSADGGNVSVLDLVIEKVHPIAFLEMVPTEEGESITEGPWNEAEERQRDDAWKARRDTAESKVQEELSKRWSRWEGFVDRLERLSSKFHTREDEIAPDHIEDLFDELDCTDPPDLPAFFRKLNPRDAGWLARFLNAKCERDRERAGDEIQAEVNEKCPPRDVRNFRIVVVRDATPSKRAGRRRAVVTIWDILSLFVSEGGQAGKIEVGQRFIMTNLKPKQPKAWMEDDLQRDSEIYLCTKRNSRFLRLK